MCGALISRRRQTWSMWSSVGSGPRWTIRSKPNSFTPSAVSAMSSGRGNKRSIAGQLVLLFSVSAAVLLTSALGMCYWLVVRHGVEEDNAALSDKLALIRQDIRQSTPATAIGMQVATGAREHSTYWIRLLDGSGRLVTETPNMAGSLPQRVFSPPAHNANGPPRPRAYRAGSHVFALVSVRDQVNGTPYVIQLAQDRSVDEAFQREFGILFFTVLALSILACMAIARTATRRGLRPLIEMTASLQRIGPTHLSERVAPARWPLELQPLAEAFDQMLNRLEESFTRLSQFSGDLAHELRTPIGNILGEAQVSLTRERTPVDYQHTIESI